MDAVGHYPHDAVKGACFISGRYEVAAGEHVLDTGIDVESLPAYGRLCLSQRAVLDMVETLGLKIATVEMLEAHEAALEALSDATAQLGEMKEAMAAMVTVRRVLEPKR